MAKKIHFNDRPCKRIGCTPDRCSSCPEAAVGLKKKPKPRVVQPHRALSIEHEIVEIDRSIYIERSCISKYRDDGDPIKFAEKRAIIEQKMTQLSVELKQLEDGFNTWQERVSTCEKRIDKLTKRKKILVNRNKLETLARLKEQAAQLAQELRDKGIEPPV
mgnify:CR=1 FL=1